MERRGQKIMVGVYNEIGVAGRMTVLIERGVTKKCLEKDGCFSQGKNKTCGYFIHLHILMYKIYKNDIHRGSGEVSRELYCPTGVCTPEGIRSVVCVYVFVYAVLW